MSSPSKLTKLVSPLDIESYIYKNHLTILYSIKPRNLKECLYIARLVRVLSNDEYGLLLLFYFQVFSPFFFFWLRQPRAVHLLKCQEGRRKSVLGKCTKSHNIRHCQSHLIDKFTRQNSLDFLKDLFI